MTLRKFALLFTTLILIGCNQSDSNSEAPADDNTGTGDKQSQSSMNENTSVVETEPEREGKVVARVNGQPIYEDSIYGRNLEHLINEEIIYQDGISRGLDKQYRARVRNFERNLIIQGIKVNILENAEPTKETSDEDIKNYYESNKDKYSHVSLYEISFPDSKLGSEIKDKARSGEELQTIADSYPDIPITVNNIGYNRAMVQHFTAIEVGSVSEVIQKPDGTFSVLKIAEIKDIPFNTAKNSIKYRLEAARNAQMIDSYIRKAAEENNMTIEIIEQESNKEKNQ